MQQWWSQWSDFIFNKKITIKKKDSSKTLGVYQLMAPILKAKYPDITPEEEAVSIPLQTLCLAIFDSILVHMLNQVSPKHWQRIRGVYSLYYNLNANLICFIFLYYIFR
jgi:hypothetical protein